MFSLFNQDNFNIVIYKLLYTVPVGPVVEKFTINYIIMSWC